MKILQVIDTFGVGGAERVAVDLSNLLHDSGLNVEVLTLLAPGPLSAQLKPEIKVTSLNRRHRLDINAILAFVRMARHFDVIHVHLRHNYRYCRLFSRLFHIKAPIILHDHSNIDHLVPLFFRTLLKPRWYIGVSNALIFWATERLNIPAERTLLLRNIIIPKKSSFAASMKQGIAMVSNIKPLKNLLFGLNLLPRLNADLTLFGKVRDQAYFKELQSKVKDLGLSEKVRFEHDCTDIQPHLTKFRLGLHTSLAESGPLALIEYLAQGLPFLAYTTGEVAKVLRPECPEFFIDNLDPDQWTERIKMLLNTPADAEKMQRVFAEHFGGKQYTEKCLKFYQKIAAAY